MCIKNKWRNEEKNPLKERLSIPHLTESMGEEANSVSAVTGASGYSGKYIAQRLLAAGGRVVNLTGHPNRPTEFGDAVESRPFSFDDPDRLTESLRGVDVLYNTYWIRFERGATTFDKAIENSKILIDAASRAEVRRIVHVSIANPSIDSPLPYYRGKALVEQAIIESGLSYAILRPTVLFGREGILINNIAWFLRHMPVFAVPGSGEYKLQPISVEDQADLAVEAGQSDENTVIDAVGPETFTFNELARLLAATVRSRTLTIHVPAYFALIATGILGRLLNDVVLTRDEVTGLSANLLASNQPPTAKTRLSEWLTHSADWLGVEYYSELRQHYTT